jgi:hypothetical protein
VNIYFGLTQFNRLKMYQNAFTDMIEKKRASMRLAKLGDKDPIRSGKIQKEVVKI